MPSPNCTCTICGAHFHRYPAWLKRGGGTCCSIQCRNILARSGQSQAGENNPGWKGGIWRSNTIAKAKEWNKNNPEKRRAHHAVQQELKVGRMTRSACSKCGSTDHVDAHHEDYSQPLDVIWLCRSCHLTEHRAA